MDADGLWAQRGEERSMEVKVRFFLLNPASTREALGRLKKPPFVLNPLWRPLWRMSPTLPTCLLKVCSGLRIPPATNAVPMTSRRFEMTDPSSDSWTTLSRLALRAKAAKVGRRVWEEGTIVVLRA